MSIKTSVEDGSGSGLLWDIHKKNEYSGGVVYTEPLREFNSVFRPLANSRFGIDMNIDASFSGTPVNIHNGIDNVYWTATSIAGTKFTFDSTDIAHAGTNSVKTDNASVSDIMQFDKGSTIDLSGYTAITMYINIDSNWAGLSADSVEIYGWDTTTASQVGVAVKLEEYFSEEVFNVWHKLSISLSDMQLEGSTVDAFRIEIATKSGKSPTWYLDTFKIEQTGGNLVFSMKPDKGTTFRVLQSVTVFAATYDSTVVNGTLLGIPWNSFLGLSGINNGLGFKVRSKGTTSVQFNFKQTSDFLDGGANIEAAIYDGTTTYYRIASSPFGDHPVILDPEQDDFVSYSISDNWTGLSHLRSFVKGIIEEK